jgi:Protein of unknown function (DUF3105)
VAKKTRTPPPPRRPVQAPRTRAGGAKPTDRRRLLLPAGLAALGVLGLVAVGAVVAFGGAGGSASAAEAFRSAGGMLETFPAQNRNHVQQVPEDFEYNSFPPTSGPHHPEPPPFGIYDEPVEQFRLIHNLEHGGVVIQYGRNVSQQTVNELLEWYRDDPNGIVIAPLPALGNRIALAAWKAEVGAGLASAEGQGVLGTLRRFDEEAFDAFMDAYAFNGPEPFSKDQLAPGS